MILYKRLPFIFLSVFILLFVLLGFQTEEGLKYSHQEKMVSIQNDSAIMFTEDPVMNLLGKTFDEIIHLLGEPDEQGHSNWYGPHYYIHYMHKEGSIRLCSPESMEKKIAVSIILGPGQKVLGARVGMTFPEIIDVLGSPDLGPEIGMDNLYYIDYIFGEINNQMPEIFLSFSSDSINSPTHDAFIKWEAFEYDKWELM